MKGGRPYQQVGIVELEEVVDRESSPHVLEQIRDELTHRTTSRASKLAIRVATKLARMKDGVGPPPDTPPVLGPVGIDQPTLWPMPVPPPRPPRPPRTRATGPIPLGHTHHLRAPDEATGARAPWTPGLKTDLAPTWKSGDPRPVVFEKALRLLVDDMKANDCGHKTIALEGGTRLTFDGTEYAYRFPWSGDDELFEGAVVELKVSGRRIDGRLVQVSRELGTLTISVEEDCGAEIATCFLVIDNTALLIALAERMARVAAGPPSFNMALANAVLSNGEYPAPPEVIAFPDFLEGLNGQQESAVRHALVNAVTYLWGPPGTGKTRTLSALLQSLFASGNRTVVSSNTNQAVDEVLLKLYDHLTRDGKHPEEIEALREGWIVRVGSADGIKQRTGAEDYLTVQGVTSRKAAALQAELVRVQARVTEVTRAIGEHRAVVDAFGELAAAEARVVSLQERLAATQRDEEAAADRLRAAQESIDKLESELSEVESAGLFGRMLRRSADVIRADQTRARNEHQRCLQLLNEASIARKRAAADQQEADALVAARRQKTHGRDRDASKKAVMEGQAAIKEASARTDALRKEIAAVESTVLLNARVVGATATKLFLAPDTFGVFSTVIVDEASMLLLPALYNAAGMARERVLVSGDFRQLPPIVETSQQCLIDELGRDVFHRAGVSQAVDEGRTAVRLCRLREQHRMHDDICQVISEPIYAGQLITSAKWESKSFTPAGPKGCRLVVVDTSEVGAVVSQDPKRSWFNVMAAIVTRNLRRNLHEGTVGVVVPYAAQRRLVDRILADAGDKETKVRTAHGFQGGECETMVLDLVDGMPRLFAGRWFQAVGLEEDGTRLLNVALSRAKEQLVVIADLRWLDAKLPAESMLRRVLVDMQRRGETIDAREVLARWPYQEELRRHLGAALPRDIVLPENATLNESEFMQVLPLECRKASEGIALFSPFVTASGAARIVDVLRERVQAGVKVRCVVRPPDQNGTMGPELWWEAINALRAAGVVVEQCVGMHQKLLLIDDKVTWFGSLNILSHAGNTGELMVRLEGEETALTMASLLALGRRIDPKQARGASYARQNPECEVCGSETRFVLSTKRNSRFWACAACSKTMDPSRVRNRGQAPARSRTDGRSSIRQSRPRINRSRSL